MAIQIALPTAGERARELDARSLIERTTFDDKAAAAVALFTDRSVSTERLRELAVARTAERRPRMHTFVPLYTTNHCDSECKMCGMRKGNDKLLRRFAGKREIEEQLEILRDEEHVRGVGFLTGEYADPYTRLANAFRIGWAIRTALDAGFERVYFNIGSMVADEIRVLGEWIDRDDPVTMCVFQETYSRSSYERFMGNDPAAPKADYDRRIASFDAWLDEGFRYVNPGVLIGLHKDVAEEIGELVEHVDRLARRGAVVDISLPRLRPAHGTKNVSGIGDDDYLRAMSAIALTCADQRIVLTTREEPEFQRRAIDLCGVFSPGSPDVAPYRRQMRARNDIDTSQFLVADLRRPSEILGEITASGREVAHFGAPAVSTL